MAPTALILLALACGPSEAEKAEALDAALCADLDQGLALAERLYEDDFDRAMALTMAVWDHQAGFHLICPRLDEPLAKRCKIRRQHLFSRKEPCPGLEDGIPRMRPECSSMEWSEMHLDPGLPPDLRASLDFCGSIARSTCETITSATRVRLSTTAPFLEVLESEGRDWGFLACARTLMETRHAPGRPNALPSGSWETVVRFERPPSAGELVQDPVQ